MLTLTYAQLTEMMTEWPVNASVEYLADLPNIIQLGELKLLRDLNLSIFDQSDPTSTTLPMGDNLIAKPLGLLQLRSMRMAIIDSTSTTNADATLLASAVSLDGSPVAVPITGAPVILSPGQQLTVTTLESGTSGISVTFVGQDFQGFPISETVVTADDDTVTTINRFGAVLSCSSTGGTTGQTANIGVAEITLNVLGESWGMDLRSKAFCDEFNAGPGTPSRPLYYNELNQTFWEVQNYADQDYGVMLWYMKRPQSIVVLGSNWLSENVADLLFAASLCEAERYIKADDRFDDMASDYNSKLPAARQELRESIRRGEYQPYMAAAKVAQ